MVPQNLTPRSEHSRSARQEIESREAENTQPAGRDECSPSRSARAILWRGVVSRSRLHSCVHRLQRRKKVLRVHATISVAAARR